MNEPFPITPSPELARQWRRTAPHPSNEHEHYCYITLCAAQWGADQELEACVAWLDGYEREGWAAQELRAARRLKPPSLKEQALKMLRPLSNPVMPGTPEYRLYEPQAEIIRRALEQL
jgi:hypothetical protein